MGNVGVLDFPEALDFSFPTIRSLKIENVTFIGVWVEGDVILNYTFNGDHEVRQHVKTKLDEESRFDIGPLQAKMHAWLDGPKLWIGVAICLGPLCTPELKTSVDIPQP